MKEQKKVSRRQQILDVSLDLFVRHGYTGTSTRGISKKIGISSGLMFHYFKSKEDLYIAHLETALDAVRMIKEYTQMPLPPIQVFSEIAESLLSYFAVSPTTAKVFLLTKQALYADYLTDEMKSVIKNLNIVDELTPLIEAGQKAGEIKGGNPRTLALCFFSAIESAAENVVCFPGFPMPESRWLVDILKK
jgi:AcrR family transcriptional regulator